MRVKDCIHDLLQKHSDDCKFARFLCINSSGKIFYNGVVNKSSIKKALDMVYVDSYVKRTGYYNTLFIVIINPLWSDRYFNTFNCRKACEKMQSDLMALVDDYNNVIYKQYNIFGGLD